MANPRAGKAEALCEKEFEPYVVCAWVLRTTFLSSDAATTTRDRPGSSDSGPSRVPADLPDRPEENSTLVLACGNRRNSLQPAQAFLKTSGRLTLYDTSNICPSMPLPRAPRHASCGRLSTSCSPTTESTYSFRAAQLCSRERPPVPADWPRD